MKLITTDKRCKKCDSTLDIVLETPYFRKKMKTHKANYIMDATGFSCSFCDSKWTLNEILFDDADGK